MKHPSHPGFTLIELLAVVAVVGILSAVGIAASGNDWRRERVNAVAIELSGWLDAVRRTSLKGNACQVTIGGGNLTSGATLATASELITNPSIANNCLTAQPMRISGSLGNSTYVIAPAGDTIFKFTPRGTVNAEATDAQLTSDVEIAISLAGTSGPTRCVRISKGLGLISIGASNDIAVTCPESSYGGTL
ncbi:pilus assembly FimT family protein [Synechococcus sp. BA-132 BA5]|uniref:pilus assembly FimT family protein n=1 Tax=Synechococcus sp. BA-132 BA5 TaxID=3110252 RepID=UPI002B1F9467|nr:prepilin-type N-terminal cleavage/methylation domain-containing protein [Synechococcus sp. BA-132 BA5]MEA5414894.1 prepilin-type N-terminal cleavage/methylation domain-containing protein [Synechococcus sp. BA-132 BA5]